MNQSVQLQPQVAFLKVQKTYDGQRLDNFLFTYLKGVPKSHIYRIVRKGEVRINKGRVKPSARLNEGDTIRIPPLRRSEEKEPTIPLPQIAPSLEASILYEDEDLLILNKSSGMASHGGSGLNFGVIEALRALRPKLERLELVHRLDRETSGCLMLAKNRETLKDLQTQMVQNKTEKQYLALVKGHWRGGACVEAPLVKNRLVSGERFVKVHPDGQSARTEFKVLETYPRATLLEIKLITGRTHQIRVHTAHVGNPVAGDTKYGDEIFNRYMKEHGLNRMFLHAHRLTVCLPNSGKKLTFVAPLEETLERIQIEMRRN